MDRKSILSQCCTKHCIWANEVVLAKWANEVVLVKWANEVVLAKWANEACHEVKIRNKKLTIDDFKFLATIHVHTLDLRCNKIGSEVQDI